MEHELIGSWLQLPPGDWPPDHYTLLGLKPGESDIVRIEQQVYERIEIVRRYQLLHPEPATEAMNRLAQALVCLTDPLAKKAYDAPFSPQLTASEPSAPPPTPVSIAEATDPLAWLFGPWNPAANEFSRPPEMLHTLVDWQAEPPPQRLRTETASDESDRSSETEVAPEQATPSGVSLSPPSLGSEPADAVAEAVTASDVSRRGLGTKRALYYRIARTRQLLWAWEQAGKYLSAPKRLKRPAEATELIRHMHAIRELLQTFPPLLGKAGQPGYLVLSLARQQMIVPMLQALLPSQREVLARDWQAGYNLLMAHRKFLRLELRALRKRNRWWQGIRSLAAGLSHHPSLLLVLLGLLALNLAVPDLREMWRRQVLALAVVFGSRLTWWWLSLRPTKIQGPRPPAVIRRRARPQPVVRGEPNSSSA